MTFEVWSLAGLDLTVVERSPVHLQDQVNQISPIYSLLLGFIVRRPYANALKNALRQQLTFSETD